MGLLAASSEHLSVAAGVATPTLSGSPAAAAVLWFTEQQFHGFRRRRDHNRKPAPAAPTARQSWLPHKMQVVGGKEENL